MLAALTAGNSDARAADADVFAKRLFADGLATTGKSHACFVRRYDAAHLANHREQKVTEMKLLISAELLPEDATLNYSFRMGVKFRDRKGKFESSGGCGHPGEFDSTADKLQLGCGVDCDGGGLSVEMANADNSTLVRIEEIAIWDTSKPGSGRSRFNSGADDRMFRLDRVSLDECKSLKDDSEDSSADQQM
jgi:hypothetical protein